MLDSLKSSEKQQAYAAAAGVIALITTLIGDTSVTTQEISDVVRRVLHSRGTHAGRVPGDRA